MAVTTYSPEGRMQTRLHQLGCSQLSFSKIVSGMIGKSRIAEAFQDPTKCFDNDIGERLLTKIAEMESLAQEIAPIPIDWTKADKVAAALVIRSVAKIARELGDPGFDRFADDATKAVAQPQVGALLLAAEQEKSNGN